MKVCEIFGNTIQGEGPLAGFPATFIRLSGCVKPYCDFCDSKYSWNEGKEMSIEEILEEVNKYPSNLVILTGGEPYAQEETYSLIDKLNLKYDVQIETSGKVDIKQHMWGETIVCSPKVYDDEILYNIRSIQPHYFKFVISKIEDINNIVDFVIENKIPHNNVFLMPLTTYDDKRDLQTKQMTARLCVENGFRYSARLHVDLWGKKRGV